MNRTMISGLAAVLVLAACGEKERELQQQAMPDMGNMPGVAGMTMQADSLMPMMRVHLDSLARLPAQSAGMLQAHEAMASQILDAMGSDMTMMGMQPDSAWTALVDSVKRDLAELPSHSGRALAALMRVHAERMRRLLSMHGGMMKDVAAP